MDVEHDGKREEAEKGGGGDSAQAPSANREGG